MTQAYGDVCPRQAGDAFIRRLACGFAGMAFVFASLGIWLVPVSEGMAPAIKFGVSFGFFIVGLLLMVPHTAAPHTPLAPMSVDVDRTAREVRLLEHKHDGRVVIGARIGFDRIGTMDVTDHVCIAKDHAGHVLLRVPLTSRAAQRRLQSQLRGT